MDLQKEPKKKVSKPLESVTGIPAYYVRFQTPVPPLQDKEPVQEFRLLAKNLLDQKYVVDAITWTNDGVVFKCKGETNIVPLANVVYCRLTV